MPEQHFDAIVIGAGISGISAAYHLQKYNPSKSYTVLERRENLGGTWDLFNYPGIRSDSDMYTFGFSFRHWDDKHAIAEKDNILRYLNDTVQEFGIDKQIQYGKHIVKASWSSDQAMWQLTSADGAHFTCRFIYMCVGYYDYDHAHDPQFNGLENFEGDVLHPQFWPDDADYAEKKVVVIGSGATAITLVPSLAEKAQHVTMLQRSPTYLGSMPAVDPVANRLASWFGRWAARWWFILTKMFQYWYCRTFPNSAKKKIVADVKALLGNKFEAKHFTPHYNPWDQRACLCPDADLFSAIKADKVSIETDHIAGFNQKGIELESGKELEADVIVTATGLKIQFFGGIDFTIDGKKLVASDSYVYKGFMLSDVPNVFLAVGYTNASWTLKVDLTHRYASRLVAHMEKHQYTKCTARANSSLQEIPLIDLSSSYIQRAQAQLPMQAKNKPWRLNQNFIADNLAMRFSVIDDDEMEFSR